VPALSGAEVKLSATRPRALGTSAQITRVEWSAAELNATVGERPGGSSAAMEFEVDTPPAGAPGPSTAGRSRVEAPRTGAGAPAKIRRQPVA
jgi:hypothetical protein